MAEGENHRIAGSKLKARLLVSRFLLALACFFVLCRLGEYAKIGVLPPNDFPFHTWTCWAVDDFFKSPVKHPSIAFLGSSLVLVPFNAVDADYLRRTIDCSEHHTSAFLRDQLKAQTGTDVSIFNFALPGEMPSDAYLISKYFFKGNDKPDLLVIGLGPRDFVDSTLKNPTDTDPYLRLARFGSVDDENAFFICDWEARLTYELQKAFYPLKHSEEFIQRTNRMAAAIADLYTPKGTEFADLWTRRKLLPSYRFWEIGVFDSLFRPTTKETADKFVDNESEYRQRYKTFPWPTFLAQTHFLSRTLDLARERHIPVVIVQMPLPEANIKLLSPMAWHAYDDTVKVLARTKGAGLIDMQATGIFHKRDFGDIVHLNSRGGSKFLEMLSHDLIAMPKVSKALGSSSDRVELSAKDSLNKGVQL